MPRVHFFKAEHACRGRSARCQPAGNLHLNFFFILASRNFSSSSLLQGGGLFFLGLKKGNHFFFLFSKTLIFRTTVCLFSVGKFSKIENSSRGQSIIVFVNYYYRYYVNYAKSAVTLVHFGT